MADRSDIRFKYLFDDCYDPQYVNGLYGGINPTGELVIHFFLERIPLPYEESVNLDENGDSYGETSIVSPEEYKFIRSIKSGIILNKKTAQSLVDWLQDVIPEMEDGDYNE